MPRVRALVICGQYLCVVLSRMCTLYTSLKFCGRLPLVTLANCWNPTPCPSSCSRTVTKSKSVPWFASKPRYQPRPPRHAGLPFRFELNCAAMSGRPGPRSPPARLSASAIPCHRLGPTGPGARPTLGKSLTMNVVPAAPRIALLAVHVRGSKLA